MINIYNDEGKILYTSKALAMKEALEEAVSKDANLQGADLREVDLRGANLQGADLQEVDLRGADLQEVDLRGADLQEVDLRGANLQDANLRGAYLQGAELRGANLQGADLTDAKFSSVVPTVENLNSKILEAIELPGAGLNMGHWHTCETVHCMAGWAIHLAGEEGYALEESMGPSAAGSLIFHRSTGHIPDFYDGDEEALEQLRARAKRES